MSVIIDASMISDIARISRMPHYWGTTDRQHRDPCRAVAGMPARASLLKRFQRLPAHYCAVPDGWLAALDNAGRRFRQHRLFKPTLGLLPPSLCCRPRWALPGWRHPWVALWPLARQKQAQSTPARIESNQGNSMSLPRTIAAALVTASVAFNAAAQSPGQSRSLDVGTSTEFVERTGEAQCRGSWA